MPEDLSQLSDAELERMIAEAEAAAAEPPAPAGPARSALEPVARGALQGATFGFGDEIAGALAAAFGGGLDARAPALDQPTFGERYRVARDYLRGANESAREAGPIGYTTGLLGGAAAVPFGAAARGASLPAIARAGAGTGAIAGLGFAEGTAPQQAGDALRGAVVGALLPPALTVAGRAAAPALSRAASSLGRTAGTQLAKVAGGIQRDVSPAGGPAAFSRIGTEGYRSGLIRPFDVFPGAANRQAARVADLARKSTGAITSAIDDAGAKIPVAPIQQSLKQASATLRQFPSANAGPLSRMDGLIDDLGKLADSNGLISGRSLQSAKKVIDDLVTTWDPTRASSLAQDLNKGLYRAIAEAQEQAVEQAGSAAGRGAYEVAKRQSALAQSLERLQDSAARREANQLSIVGGLVGAGSGVGTLLATGDPLKALGAIALSRVAQSPRSSAIATLGAQQAARGGSALAGAVTRPGAMRGGTIALIEALRRRAEETPSIIRETR